MKSIVIITYYMSPFAKSFGSCQRIFFLANQLIENDYKVTVISKYEEIKYVNFGNEAKFENYYLTIGGKILDAKQIFKEYKKSKFLIIFYRIISKIILIISPVANKKFNETNINHSIEPLIWILKNRKNFERIIKEKNAQAVILSAPPFHLLRITDIIKKVDNKIKVIIDYRDPWNFNKSRISELEKKILYKSDLILSFSLKFKQHLENMYGLPENKILSIYNGYSISAWSKAREPVKDVSCGKIIFTYAGSYSFANKNFADITPLLKSIEINKYSDIIFRFIGKKDSLNANYWLNRLNGRVEFIDYMNHEKVIEYLLISDVQIVLFNYINNRSKFMITTKFFDYLRSGKIIWGIGDPESNFCQMIENNRLGFTCKPEVDEISKTIEKIIYHFSQNSLLPFKRNGALIEEYSRENQFKKLINQLI